MSATHWRWRTGFRRTFGKCALLDGHALAGSNCACGEVGTRGPEFRAKKRRGLGRGTTGRCASHSSAYTRRSYNDHWPQAQAIGFGAVIRTGDKRFQRCHRRTQREAWPCVESLLGDNINQRIGLRYFFRVDHSLLVGFDRYRRGILGLISNKAYLGSHRELERGIRCQLSSLANTSFSQNRDGLFISC